MKSHDFRHIHLYIYNIHVVFLYTKGSSSMIHLYFLITGVPSTLLNHTSLNIAENSYSGIPEFLDMHTSIHHLKKPETTTVHTHTVTSDFTAGGP